MITKAQAKVGKRVKWQSLDASIPPAFGRVTAIGPSPGLDSGEIAIEYDDGEMGTTYVDSGASVVWPA
jgi:hypothetical protein